MTNTDEAGLNALTPAFARLKEQIIKGQHYQMAADFREMERALIGHFGNYESVMETNKVLAQRLIERETA